MIRRAVIGSNQKLDPVARANDAAALDAAIEARAIVEGQVDRETQQLFQVFAGEVQSAAAQDHVANTKPPPDQMIERHTPDRQIAAMVLGSQDNRSALQRRIVAASASSTSCSNRVTS
jgi:hypothetical protein